MERSFVRTLRIFGYLLPLGALIFIVSSLLVLAQEAPEPQLPDAMVPSFSGQPSLIVAPLDATPLPPMTIDNAQTDNPTEENLAMQMVNDLRQRIGGINCLVVNETLRTAAYEHSKDMHDNNFFDFTNPTTLNSTQKRAQAAGYTGVVGVSITAGANGIRDSAAEAIAHIRSSRSNYFNLITAQYEEIGIGWYSGTQNFQDYWTIALGAEGGTSAVPCSGTPGPITHIPTVQNTTNCNLTLPTYNWTHNTATTAGRTPATHYDVEVLDMQGNRVLRAPSSTVGPTYAADNYCTATVCSVTPAANAYDNGTGLVDGQTYVVWVRAWSVDGGYVWSSTGAQFTVDSNATPEPTDTPTGTPEGPAPILLAPLNNITSDYGNPSFVWSGVAGATTYEIYVALKSNLSTPIIYAQFDAARNCQGISCSVPDMALLNPNYRLLVEGQYSVFLRAFTGSTPGSWSTEYTFTLDAAPPDAVTIGGVQALTATPVSRPAYVWTLPGSAAYAAWFYVYVAPENNLFQPVVSQWVSRIEACGSPNATTCVWESPSDWLSNTPHAIYIQSYGPGGYSIGGINNTGYAGLGGLTTNAALPTLLQGFTVTTNQGRPTLSFPWDDNAAWYQVRVATPSNQTVASTWVQNSCGGLTCTLAPAIDVAAGTYQIYLQSWGPAGFNNNNPNSFSGPEAFAPNFPAPSNVSGLAVGNVNSGNPTLMWNGSAGATWYFTFVQQGSVPVYSEWHLASDIGCGNGGICTVTPPFLILTNNTSYTWAVYAYGPGGFSGAAQGPTINVSAGLAPTKPELFTPNNLTYTTQASPTFEWRHVDNVSYYQVSVNAGQPMTDPDVLTPTYTQWVHAAALNCTDDNVCVLDVPGLFLGNGQYSWFVRGYSPAGLGPWSDPKNFTVRLP